MDIPKEMLSAPSAVLMEKMVMVGSAILRDDDSLLRTVFFSVLRYGEESMQ
jgi:hypothetical protein